MPVMTPSPMIISVKVLAGMLTYLLIFLAVQPGKPEAMADEIGKDEREDDQADAKGKQHTRRHLEHRPAAASNHNGMDRSEQANGKKGQGNGDHAHDHIYGAQPGFGLGGIQAAAQEEVNQVDDLHDGGGGQAGIPDPPGVPDRASPDHPAQNGNQPEHQPYLNSREREPVPARFACGKVANAPRSSQDETEHTRPGRGDMKIKHFLNGTHGQFRRCEKQDQGQGCREGDRREDVKKG